MKRIILAASLVLATVSGVSAADNFNSLRAIPIDKLKNSSIIATIASTYCDGSNIHETLRQIAKQEFKRRKIFSNEDTQLDFLRKSVAVSKFFATAEGKDKEYLCRSAILSSYKLLLPVSSINMLECSSFFAHKIILTQENEEKTFKYGMLMASFKNMGEKDLQNHGISKVYSGEYYQNSLASFEGFYSDNRPQYIVNAGKFEKICMSALENKKLFGKKFFEF